MNVFFVKSVTGKWLGENGILVKFNKARLFVNLVSASEGIENAADERKLKKEGFKVVQLVEVKI